MDTLKSIFKGYGKVDETQDLALKRKNCKRWVGSGIFVVVLVIMIIVSSVAVAVHSRQKDSHHSTPSHDPELTPAASLKTVCSVTNYPASCISSISKLSSNTTDPEVLFKLSLKVVVDELNSISGLPRKLAEETDDESIKSALGVCGDMFDEAIDRVNETISVTEVGDGKSFLNPKKIDDLLAWLTAAVTDHDTCLDALDETEFGNSTISQELKSAMVNSTEFTSNSLAIVAKILTLLSDYVNPIHRRRLLSSTNSIPSWVSPGVRRLLQAENVKPNVTVAADGSGDVKMVNEAVARVPSKGTTMFIIYVKSGTYVEYVNLDKSKWNVMIYGDGKDKTIISGSKNCIDDKIKTFYTATLGVQGKGFIMKDIRIINTAGPLKAQAVAFRSGSDSSVYYRCSFDGFQDTLYPHSLRQFYRDCDVTGTVDFIFGRAKVVFQGCNIRPRQPLPKQFNTITAQGREDPNHDSGISIQRCTISPNGNVTAPTYLGRPWKVRSTTVVMESVIGSIVNPAGWARWNASADPPASIYYGEYKNSGPGSDVTKRVEWAGYKPILSDAEAGRFTAGTFLNGDEWIPGTGVPYQLY